MKNSFMQKKETVERNWYVIDAEGKTLGRLAVLAANMLRGKHKPQFTPHVDTGDFIIVINAEKVVVTGKKETDKIYYSHTGYPGGFKTTAFKDLMAKNPCAAIEKAVKGMLPHNTLGQEQFNKLKVYAGPNPPHKAQNPILLDDKEVK